jgi:cytochrome c biogenesis protein CcdA/thiol-disulfide isomerase/thioredoxin
MVLLLLFAAIAGAATAVSPCALPVLPALLSAGATGGRRRPLGVVTGLSVTFAITIIGLAKVAGGVGLGDGTLRTIAIVVLLAFGIAVAVPAVSARLEAPLSRLIGLGPRTTGHGFVSGLGVGAALGFVYAPCAGPILAAVISVSAASGRTVAVGIAYTLGAAAVLLALSLGGRRALARVPRGPGFQAALGAVMIVTAIAMLARLDIRLQTALAQHLGGGGIAGFLADPAGGLERSHAVNSRLADLRGQPKFHTAAATAATQADGLPVLGTAPDFTGTQRWFNSRPLTMAGLRGRVVLIDFWTYTCINCIRTQPYLKAWDARYRRQGLTIVGVHSPEFGFEKDAGNVQRAVRAAGLRYAVVQDNDLKTWQAWGNQYWPAEYLVDAQGHVRYTSFGEGDYDKTEEAIRTLLGARGAMARPRDVVVPSDQTTPETYVGAARAQGFAGTPPTPGTRRYAVSENLGLSRFSLGGTWKVSLEDATAVRDATLTAHVRAKNVYLVLSGPGTLTVRVDGGPPRRVAVRTQRLYTLARRGADGDHVLKLSFTPGLSAFAFTFG